MIIYSDKEGDFEDVYLGVANSFGIIEGLSVYKINKEDNSLVVKAANTKTHNNVSFRVHFRYSKKEAPSYKQTLSGMIFWHGASLK